MNDWDWTGINKVLLLRQTPYLWISGRPGAGAGAFISPKVIQFLLQFTRDMIMRKVQWENLILTSIFG